MDWKSTLLGIALGAFSTWLHRALKLRTKTAQQSDTILGAPAGTSQAVLDAAENAVETAAGQAAQKALEKK